MSAVPKFREFEFGITRAVKEERGDCVYLRAEQALKAYPERMTDRLVHWAKERPSQSWMARRDANGQWVHITYAEAWAKAQAIGQALLNHGLSMKKPLAILSENSLEHALLMLGAMTVGVPFCSVSTAYSLMSQDYGKLRHVLDTITPGLVYASDYAKYGKAIEATVAKDIPIATDSVAARKDSMPATIGFDSLIATEITPAVHAAMQVTNGDTIVKFLFTSGSTKLPKAVINTQRMICANQQQIYQSMPSIFDLPPVLVDWPPWNHTFGGNHDFYLVIYHGGTFYINDGKPTPALIGETIRNLTEIAPTIYYDVPISFEMLATEMKTNAALRKNLLSRCRMFFYAGAALAQPIWDSLYESEEKELGYRIPMTSGLGMTESAPFGLFVTNVNVKAGDLGLPCAGMQLKLVPTGDKVEARYRGPNITPGYWKNPEATKEAFDEEGFLSTGDAVKWIDEANFHLGLKFDGRVAEDFKLSSGTFVSVGPLRAKLIAACAPYIQDVVITGLNMREVGALIIPALIPAKKALGLPDAATYAEVATHPKLRAALQTMLTAQAAIATGSASRIIRAVVLSEPPNIDKGEITDKGSINQRAVLTHRAALVEALYADAAPNMLKP
ncbi:MAG: feruloyl-CoA synthase [Burkholderiales bacterium]|nr:MAG: feruloyl-CoA synthase [Burkholderiales bacterium]